MPWNGNVQFRNNIFDARGDDAIKSAPESPGLAPLGSKHPKMRYFDPMGNQQLIRTGTGADLSRQSSGGSETARERAQGRSGAPLRISTVSGVGGRKYAAAEPKRAFAGNKLSSPKQLGVR